MEAIKKKFRQRRRAADIIRWQKDDCPLWRRQSRRVQREGLTVRMQSREISTAANSAFTYLSSGCLVILGCSHLSCIKSPGIFEADSIRMAKFIRTRAKISFVLFTTG